MLEANKIGVKIFADVNQRLDQAGLMMHGGAIVDASLIAAPKSIKNQDGKSDPEMHQTKKGNEWYFGMKVPAGVVCALWGTCMCGKLNAYGIRMSRAGSVRIA